MPILDKVREVEAESKQLVEDAKTQAAQSIADEIQNGETLLNLLNEEMKSYRLTLVNKREQELSTKEQEIRASYEQAIEADKKASMENSGKAIDFIIASIGEEE